MSYKNKAYYALYGSNKEPLPLKIQIAISSLIILNVLAVMLESVNEIGSTYKPFFILFESISILIFAFEYFARVWVANLENKYKKPIIGRLSFIFSPMALIDLIAFLPSLLLLTGIDLRSLRIFRVLRLLKLTRYSEAMSSVTNAIKAGKKELVLSLILMFVLLLICSTLIFFAEHEAQPKVFSSIPASLWWAVITLTTIGYGDVYPVTFLGKIIAGISAIFGIGMFALPGGIIASELIVNAKKKNKFLCPHCKKNIKH